MFPVAHIASAALINRLFRGDSRLGPAIAGALLPDAIDKPLALVLLTPSHHVGHTPLAALALSVLVALAFGRERALSFGTAYIVHLLGDELHHGRVPWLMPLSDSKRRRDPHNRFFLALELPAAALMLFLARRPPPEK